MRRFTEYIVLIATAIIFTLYHAVLTSLVISASEELELRFSYIFGVELLAFLPVALTMLVIIWASKVSPKLFTSFNGSTVSFHLFMALGLFVIHAIWQSWINHQFFGSEFNVTEISDDFMGFLVMRFFLYIIVIGLVGGMVKLREHRKALNKSSQLQLELQKAKLKEMEMRMNPEIIYTNLGYIKKSAGENPEGASQMVILMASLLRKLVDNFDKEKVTIEDDIQVFQRYINMVSLRLERRIETQIQTNGVQNNHRIPSMILIIPFLEELFFGKYNAGTVGINEIIYRVTRIDCTQTNIQMSFEWLSLNEDLQNYLENDPLIEPIKRQFEVLSNSTLHFSTEIDNNRLILLTKMFTRETEGELYV